MSDPTRPDDEAPHLDTSRFSPGNRRRLSAPAFRTFLAISDLWQLTERERLLVLGMPSRSALHRWAKAAREQEDFTLSVDTLTRMSAVLGIHQALVQLHGAESDGIGWLRRPNTALVFGGHPPMDCIVCGSQDGLLVVRRFLDAMLNGGGPAPNSADWGFEAYVDENLSFS